METLYSSWNPGEQYRLTTLSGSSSSGSSSSSVHQISSGSCNSMVSTSSYLGGCDTPPTPMASDSVLFNMFYSPSSLSTSTCDPVIVPSNGIKSDPHFESQQPIESVNYLNTTVSSDYYHNGSSSCFLSQNNYSIPTSMESPANTSYSSPSPSPDLWENYGYVNIDRLQANSNLDQSNQTSSQQYLHHHSNPNHQHHQLHVTNYHNHQDVQHQINNKTAKSNYNNNHHVSVTNNAAVNTNDNSNNNNTVVSVNKSTTKSSYKQSNSNKKSSNCIKNASANIHINENLHLSGHQYNQSYHHRTTSAQHSYHNHHHHHPHHRSLESRGVDKYLSPEDEERRRRRRERNKVAATKCRNKKKVHVYKLCQESQTLELTNSTLKEEMQNLKREEQQLNELLVKHLPYCVRRTLQPISDSLNI